MKRKLFLISTLFVLASNTLIGCGNQEAPVKYAVTITSNTLNINVVNEIEKGKDLTFEVTLTQDSQTKGYLLPDESTTSISIGNMVLGESNYVYNADYEHAKGLFSVPSCFINEKVNLAIEAYKPELIVGEIKLENNNTPIKLLNDDKPILGTDYLNVLEVINGDVVQYGLPSKIQIECIDAIDKEPYKLVAGQYFYDNETGNIFIPGEFLEGDIVIYAEAVDFKSIKISIYMFSENTLSFKVDTKSGEVHYNDQGVGLIITPADPSYFLPEYIDGVTINGIPADYNYLIDNERLANLAIGGKILGDIVIYAKGVKQKAVKMYNNSSSATDVVAVSNPDLVINAPVYAYLAPKNPAEYKLPATLEKVQTMIKNASGQLEVYTFEPSQYYYDSSTGLFLITNKDLVTDIISIVASAVAK